MAQEVVHIGEIGASQFQEKMDKEIEWRNNNGWRLVDTELSTTVDNETDDLFLDALLTFEQ